MSGRGRDRRAHQRVGISIPISVRHLDGEKHTGSAATTDIAPGGVRFETDEPDLQVGDAIGVGLTIPSTMGYLPQASRATADAKVVRVEADPDETGDRPVRVRVAAKFNRPIRLDW